MKKKLLSLLVAATMIGSMAGTTTVFAGEDLEDVSEPVTLSLMVTTRPSTDNKDFYLDLLPELVHEKFPNITIEVEQLPTDQYKQTVRLKFASGDLVGEETVRGFSKCRLCKRSFRFQRA